MAAPRARTERFLHFLTWLGSMSILGSRQNLLMPSPRWLRTGQQLCHFALRLLSRNFRSCCKVTTQMWPTLPPACWADSRCALRLQNSSPTRACCSSSFTRLIPSPRVNSFRRNWPRLLLPPSGTVLQRWETTHGCCKLFKLRSRTGRRMIRTSAVTWRRLHIAFDSSWLNQEDSWHPCGPQSLHFLKGNILQSDFIQCMHLWVQLRAHRIPDVRSFISFDAACFRAWSQPI
mmetsp:Transcript_31599/g.57453  ORF Transcript_31599/g.57453 Transcript_31599/m.57453 type:complete len:232 (+) Transcript_31599:865-1560(+)